MFGNLEDILRTITSFWILTKDARSRFQTLGVKYQEWPECESKNWIRRFETEDKDVVSFDYANWETEKQIRIIDLPLDDNEFVATYKRFLRKSYFQRLGELLIRNPDDGARLLNLYKNDMGAGVDLVNAKVVLIEALKSKEEQVQRGDSIVTVKGFENLSEMIGGFNGGRINLFGAVTGFGKTTFGLNLAMCAAETMDVTYFNMEMLRNDLGGRMTQIGTRTEAFKWNRGEIDYGKFAELITRPGLERLWITNGRALSLTEIEAAIEAKHKNGGLVVVDYDQKIRTDLHKDEWQALNMAIQSLEETAKAFNVSILVLCQMHESGEIKSSKRMIQSASCLAMFECENETEGIYSLEFKKNRFGSLKNTLRLKYTPSTGRIYELGAGDKKRKFE